MIVDSGASGHQSRNPDSSPTFGETLRLLRGAAGLTQEELAERAGLSAAAVAALESGRRRRPHPATVRALTAALGLAGDERARLLLDAARAAAPAPGPRDGTPQVAQLPMDIGDFTGRRPEVTRLVAALTGPLQAGGPVPVVVVTGKPGVGKSTLAVHVGHRLRGAFPNGQLHAALRGTSADAPAPAGVLAGFLRALRVAGTQQAPVEELSALYRSALARRPMLVVLDDARDEAHVLPLLPAAPGCAVLVTSRSRLASLPGAVLLDLDDLDVEAGVELLAAIVGPERALREPEPAADVVRSCGGLPLSIRIAGATLRARPHWSVAAYAARLAKRQHRLDALRFGDLDVRGSLGLGYDNLPLTARAALRRLPVLPSLDVSADAVGALMDWDRDRAENALEQLQESHWVRGVAEGRYRAHDLVLAFAEERLQAEETPEARDGAWVRLLRWCRDGAAARLEADPRAESAELVDWIEAERPNLLAMAGRANDTGHCREALDIAVLLGAFSELQESWTSEDDACAIGLRAARQIGDRLAEVRLLVRQAGFLRDMQRRGDAERTARRALDLARELGDRRSEGRALNVIGDLDFSALRHAAAEAGHRESAALLGADGDHYGEASALIGLAFDAGACGRWDEATDCLRRAEGAFRDLGHLGGLAYTLTARATTADFLAEWDEALACVETSLAIHRRLRSPWGEYRALNRMGSVLLHLGRWERAAAAYEEALGIATSRQRRSAEVDSLNGLGAVCAARGHWDRAAGHHERALAAAAATNYRTGAALALANLGLARASLGDSAAAAEAFDAAFDRSRLIQEPFVEARLLELQGRACQAGGRRDEAAAALVRSRAIYRSLRLDHFRAVVEALLREAGAPATG